MPTDLRAALRDVLASAHPNERDHPTMFAAWKRAKATLDAPPTVAELLTLVDAGHEVWWTDVVGDECRVRLGANPPSVRLIREQRSVPDGGWYRSWQFSRADLAQPATLVEVTP